MRTTTDTLTGKPFRWNSTCTFQDYDGTRTTVPQRMTGRTCTFLHPSRTLPALLRELNPTTTEHPTP